MAEPNPKRTKMDNPGTSTSTRPEEPEIEEGNLITGTQNFPLIRNMPGFVDHTHFIRSFLLVEEPKFAIFAPRRFGKSSHLNMVKTFLQIDVDPITEGASSSVNGPVENRINYKVFDGTRIITDGRHKKLVEDHLGKHPVIHLDFKTASISSVEEALEHCRMVMHEAFCEHSYLATSTKLDPGSKERNASCQRFCNRWCDIDQFAKQKLSGSLKNFTRFLYNHFDGAKVYILVDEFDALNACALRGIRGNDKDDTVQILDNICNILATLLGDVTKGDNHYFGGALVTGVSYVSGLGYSTLLNNFTVLRFLDDTKIMRTDKDFVAFYGATTEEVRSLIQKLVRNKELMAFEGKKEFLNETNELDADKIMRDVQSRYNGYFDTDGRRIFCLWSVLHYLQSGKAKNYWNQTEGIDELYKILKCQRVASKICKLVRGDEFIRFESYYRLKTSDLVKLHDLMLKEDVVDIDDVDIVFNFLMHQGYLSYPEGGSQDGNLFKLPNAEIRAALSDMIRDILFFWRISTKSLTRLIDGISSSLMKDEKLLEEKMLDFYEAMPNILKPIEEMKRPSLNETVFSFALHNTLYHTESFFLQADLPIEDVDRGTLTSLCRPDFLLFHKLDTKCSILFELKFKKEGKDIYTTSLYALQEARGKIATKKGNIKKYMNALEKLGREALVIGLSMDSDLKVSCSYAFDKEGKIFYMSEMEAALCSDFYGIHNPTSLLPKENNA